MSAIDFLNEKLEAAEFSLKLLEDGRQSVYEYISKNNLDESLFEERLIRLNQNIDRLKEEYRKLGELTAQAANEAAELAIDISKSE